MRVVLLLSIFSVIVADSGLGKTEFGYSIKSKILRPPPDTSGTPAALLQRISGQDSPIILSGLPSSSWASLKWTKDYLSSKITEPVAVFSAHSPKIVEYIPSRPFSVLFPPPKTLSMQLSEFFSQDSCDDGSHVQLQKGLFQEEMEPLLDDLRPYEFLFVDDINEPGLSPESEQYQDITSQQTAILTVGDDELELPPQMEPDITFYVQIKGKSHWVLTSPAHHASLYPHSWLSPYHLQSQLNFTTSPSFDTIMKFPKFVNIDSSEGTLDEGEILYVPPFWSRYMKVVKGSAPFAAFAAFSSPSLLGAFSQRLVQQGLPTGLVSEESGKPQLSSFSALTTFVSLLLTKVKKFQNETAMKEFIEEKLMNSRFASLLSELNCTSVEGSEPERYFDINRCGSIFPPTQLSPTVLKSLEDFTENVKEGFNMIDGIEYQDIQLLDYIEKVTAFLIPSGRICQFWRCMAAPNPHTKDEL